MTQTLMAAADALLTIDLDLSMVLDKLAHPEDGEGWSAEQLDLAQREYLKFLALCRAYPEEAVVPCKLVDELWHAHILDTRAYRDDCQRIFGCFYDHYPYFGLRDAEDAINLERAYDRTLDLYDQNFGEAPEGTWWTVKGARCRTGCRPMKCRGTMKGTGAPSYPWS
jgi:hypothetical protein